MTPVVVIEVVLVFGSVLLWYAWQLYSLREPPRPPERPSPPPPPSPPPGNEAEPEASPTRAPEPPMHETEAARRDR